MWEKVMEWNWTAQLATSINASLQSDSDTVSRLLAYLVRILGQRESYSKSVDFEERETKSAPDNFFFFTLKASISPLAWNEY